MDPSRFFLSVHELLDAYRAGTLDPRDIVSAHLLRAERLDPALNAFMWLDPDGAGRAAEASSRRWARGRPRGALDGVPVTVKDIVDVAGTPNRAGSLAGPGTPAAEDAPEVARLREAGAIIIGKTTTPEFGWKGITDGPLFGTTRNPWNPAHSPGGSSGGAGASLAAGIGALAFGNDGGGSIRIPASYSGVVGLKPSFGRVPHGPPASAFSTLVAGGPLARTVEDAALALNVLSRPDVRDPYALPYERRDWRRALAGGLEGLRIAWTTELGEAECEPAVADAFAAAIERIAASGVRVERVGAIFPPLRPIFEAYWLAGFASTLRTMPEAERDRLDPGFRALAERGLAVGAEALEAGIVARGTLTVTMNRFHEDFDVLLTPTMPTPPPPADTVYHSQGFDRWRHAVPFTVPFNLTGQPAMSLPCAVTGSGLPIGLQIVGPRHGDNVVLRAGAAIEKILAFPQPHPRLAASLAEIGG
jgi:aspartyl-tRNA(Asn)/glutamyl-tRNA(Gln) amidotransferase subunit A